MFDDAFYWIFCAVIVAVVVIKSGRKPKTQGVPRAYLIGVVLGSLASFGIGFLMEHTNPIDILLLRKVADIYSVFLISIAYGMLVRVVLWVITGAKPPSRPPQTF